MDKEKNEQEEEVLNEKMGYFERLKRNWKITFISVLLVIPVIIYFIERKSLVNFLGGYVGAILTLGGVWFQIQRLEKHRKEDERTKERERKLGVLKYLKFILRENVEMGEKTGIAYKIQSALSYYEEIISSDQTVVEIFLKFKVKYLEENLNMIMELSENIGEEILKLDMIINHTVDKYNCLVGASGERKNLRIKINNKKLNELSDDAFYKNEQEIMNRKIYEKKEVDFTREKSDDLMIEIMKELQSILMMPEKIERKLFNDILKQKMLDEMLIDKGFEIIKKSKELLEKVEKEIKKIEII